MSPDFAMRANSMIAADISPVALARARERCASFPNVQFHAFDLLTDDLPDSFDAIICAGVLVFIPKEQQALIRDKIVSRLEPGGDLLLEHTRDAFPGEAAGGAVHQLYRMHSLLTEVDHVDADNYAITVFRKRSA
jgi:SAM-dependent methyltransferase